MITPVGRGEQSEQRAAGDMNTTVILVINERRGYNSGPFSRTIGSNLIRLRFGASPTTLGAVSGRPL